LTLNFNRDNISALAKNILLVSQENIGFATEKNRRRLQPAVFASLYGIQNQEYVRYILIGSALSYMLQMPHGQMPAQMPQPMHLVESDTYS
jgi:hypothetical protein